MDFDSIKKRLDELQAEAESEPKIGPASDPGQGVAVTDAMVDAEMVRLGWARWLIGGFVGDRIERRAVLPLMSDDAGWQERGLAQERFDKRRQQVRAELEQFERDRVNKSKGARAETTKADKAEAYARQLVRDKGLSKSRASEFAAKKFGVASSTIRNRLKESHR